MILSNKYPIELLESARYNLSMIYLSYIDNYLRIDYFIAKKNS